MKRRKWWGVVVGLFVLTIASSALRGAENASTAENPSRYQNKIVLVGVLDSMALESHASSEYLRDPVVEKIGDRYFITGEVVLSPVEKADPTTLWREGAVSSIALSRVTNLYIYSPEQFEAAMKTIPVNE